MKSNIPRSCTLAYLSLASSLCVAGTADQWKDYQAGRNPGQEMLEIAIGIVVLGFFLYAYNKIKEHSKVKERKRKKARKARL